MRREEERERRVRGLGTATAQKK